MNTFHHQWQSTYATMQRIRPRLERLARQAPGAPRYYRANLAHQWRVFLVREVLS